MKTNLLTTAIVAFTIQAMVNGQTPANPSQRILATIGEKNVSTKKEKPMPQLISSEENENAADQKKSVNTLLKYSGHLPKATFTKAYAEKLSSESETLLEASQIVRNDCGKEKDKQLSCDLFISLQKQAQHKQLISSEIKGKINFEQFTLNLTLINSLLSKLENTNSVYQTSYTEKQTSIHLMKIAREMREEAYSLENTAAMLGTLSNAEEKENLSLDTQNKTIVTLKKSVAFYISFSENALALK